MKSYVTDLAVFGGRPTFDAILHVGSPNIGDRKRLHALIDDALDRRWLTNDGPYVHEFESQLRDLLRVRNAMVTTNATTALMLVAEALELRGEVIVPSLTFVATAHALTWQRLTPVFCAVDPVTWTLDPAKAAELVTDRTTALVGVHLWGAPCDVMGLGALAARHGLKVVYDASHALGTAVAGRPVGASGDAEVFSFHATKVCNSFEGGAVTTDDDDFAGRVALARNFGFADVDHVVSLGINAKMSEVHAAMGLVSLEALDQFVSANRTNWRRYSEQLEGIAGMALYDPPMLERTSARSYVVVEVQEAAGLSRDELVTILTAENVSARRYFYPGCHRMEPYRSQRLETAARLSVTEAILDRVLVLPTGSATTLDSVDRVCELLAFATARSDEIRSRLRRSQDRPR